MNLLAAHQAAASSNKKSRDTTHKTIVAANNKLSSRNSYSTKNSSRLIASYTLPLPSARLLVFYLALVSILTLSLLILAVDCNPLAIQQNQKIQLNVARTRLSSSSINRRKRFDNSQSNSTTSSSSTVPSSSSSLTAMRAGSNSTTSSSHKRTSGSSSSQLKRFKTSVEGIQLGSIRLTDRTPSSSIQSNHLNNNNSTDNDNDINNNTILSSSDSYESQGYQRNINSINGTIDLTQYGQNEVDRLYGDALLVYFKNFNE